MVNKTRHVHAKQYSAALQKDEVIHVDKNISKAHC